MAENREKIERIKECTSEYRWKVVHSVLGAFTTTMCLLEGIVIGITPIIPLKEKILIDTLLGIGVIVVGRFTCNSIGLAKYYSNKRKRLLKK